MRSFAPSGQRQVDVLMLSDLRLPGGTSHSLAEEIAAQAEAGWSTGLIHLNGPLMSWLRPINPRIREQQVRRGGMGSLSAIVQSERSSLWYDIRPCCRRRRVNFPKLKPSTRYLWRTRRRLISMAIGTIGRG